MTWREQAAPIIADTILRVGRQDQQALRRALRDAYPFGERAHYPYKAWRDEIKAQLGHGMRSDRTAEKAGQVDAFENQEETLWNGTK